MASPWPCSSMGLALPPPTPMAMPLICLVLSEWQSQWAILFHWGLPWTSPWPCHGIAKCPSDWPPHGPGYSMVPFIGNHPCLCHGIDLDCLIGHPMAQALPWRCSLPLCPCHGIRWCFLIGHHMGQALPLALYWHHLWPCHGIAWRFLIGNPMGQALPWGLHCTPPSHTHGHAMALPGAF